MHTNLPNVTLVSPHRGGLPRGFDVTYPAKQVPGHTRNTWDETRPLSHRRPLGARHAVRLGSRVPCGKSVPGAKQPRLSTPATRVSRRTNQQA